MNHMHHQWDDSMDDSEVWAEAASLFLNDSDGTTDIDSGSQPSPIKSELSNDNEKPLPLEVSSSSPPMKRKRVNRRREEILFLRKQAQQLEERLLATRQRMQESVVLERHLQPVERELLTAAWATVATQQRSQRAQSEAEHSRLRQLVDDQRQLAKSLQRYARRHTMHEIPAQLLHHPQDAQQLTAPASFDELERALQSMFTQRNAVFRDPRFDAVLSTLRASRIVNPDTPQAGVEVMDARVLPFDVQTTATALWQSMVHRVAAVAYDETFESPTHDVIQRGFVAAVELPTFQTTVRARVVVRRIVEAERVVILRATHFEPIGLMNHHHIEPFAVRHYQWSVVESPRHERLRKNGSAMAQIQSFDLSFPSLPSGSASERHGPTETTILQFCESAAAYHVDLSRQAMENMLVGDALKTASTSTRQQGLTEATIKLEAC